MLKPLAADVIPPHFLNDITSFIFVENAPAESDIIFIPGSSYPALPEKAAALYREGFAPLILPSGRYSIKNGKFAGVKDKTDIYSGNYETECAFYTDVLIKNGVPPSAIIQEDSATFTRENAVFSRRLTDERGLAIRRAIVCCKSFHARRALSYYQLAFPEAELLAAPAEIDGVNRYNWHTTEYGIRRVMGELARCGSQFEDEITKQQGILQ